MRRFHEAYRTVSRAIGVASLACALIAAPSLAVAHARHHHPHHAAGHAAHPLRGIDVSHYQGAINWRAVAHDHVSFAYLKATEGVDGRDARFARNWTGAERAGLSVGAYHFFNFCRSGRAQAANFVAVAPRHAGALPPAVDLEPGGRCTRHLKGAVVRRELTQYLNVVEAHERQRAVLYVTPQFYRAYHRYLPERAMWRRSIAARPASPSLVWQYKSRGRVAGIRSRVDLDLISRRA